MRRLSPALLTMGMLGIVGLLVVAYVGKKLLAREAPAAVDNRMTVPMALTDLEPGTRVTEAHLAMGPADRSKITRDTVLTNRVLIGRVVKNKISAAQPINTQDLYPPGKNAPLQIDPGMVAVTLQATPPFVAEKGQYVNVHFIPSADPDTERTGGQILTLFQGVKVLDLTATGAMRSQLNVVLELTREQANIILLARDKGTLNYSFAPSGRGNGGIAVNDEDRATLYEILGYTPRPPESPIPPFRTDIFNGTRRGMNSFRDGLFIDQYNQNPIFNQGGGAAPARNNGGNSGGGQQQETGSGSGSGVQSSPPSA
ncbi:Flp pilus assembly protein CpaB [Planctomicrobium piriforme]|uniref:Pilus assembly protein CpaB n=1 Tax=Planctomicrobium piriforme TaxID=1576369 RepID=A0A1I3P6G2_9PLAN|nr:SAF domain-containing protein [Planctomicrobium piriforme]SFJ16626.1 pilus assembly protein CpaB [Planctomicrobium piriforme]